MKNPHLILEIPGATSEELQRGLRAAAEFFESEGIHPVAAAAARFKVEGQRDDLSDQEIAAHHAWEQAQDIALEACCQGWSKVPDVHWPLSLGWDA